MIVFGNLTFSSDSAMSVAETYAHVAPTPAFMKVIGPYIRSNIEAGIATKTIYEFDDAMLDEALEYLKQRYTKFGEIPGVTATYEEWLGVATALKVLEETHSITESLEIISFSI